MVVPEIPDPRRWKETVRRQWADAAPGWRKTHAQAAIQSRAATDAIIETLQVEPGMYVLDLACGSGLPAHDISALLNPGGRVIATDMVLEMLATARDIARQQDLTNISFFQTDAENLPFADRTFDAVTCRFGVMFFPDTLQALGEVRRVLKSGGSAAFVAWGPLEDNPYFMVIETALRKYVESPPSSGDAPLPDLRFRFAQPGGLSSTLWGAGLNQVEEETRRILWPFPGTPEEALQRILEGANRRLFDSIPLDQREKAATEVLEAIQPFYDGHKVNFPATIVLGSAVR